MSKKRPSYATPHAPARALPAEPAASSAKQAIVPILLSAVFFLIVCLSSTDTVKITAVVVAIAALVTAALRFTALRSRIGLPLLALFLVALCGGISTFYAISGKFALNEFIKTFLSFSLVIILLAAAPGKGERPRRWIATILEGAAALAGLISVDLLSTRLISTPSLGFLGLFTSYYDTLSVVEPGVRMTSVFDAPNVFAGVVGLGTLLSLGLAMSSGTRGERRLHLCCLYINAASFVLAFSMGASGAILAAFILYLILERKDARAALFVLMAETLILVLIPAMLISQTSFGVWDGFDPVPTLCLVLGSAALIALDEFVGRRVVEKLAAKGKLMLALIGGALAALLVFGVLAVTVTGSADLAAGESLRRAAYPEEGEYEIFASFGGSGDLTGSSLTVVIESQNEVETMMHTSTVLYSGELNKAKFTVPEDSTVVYFNITAHTALKLHEVELHGGSVVTLPLEYKLLPSFIANRLQGLFANENAIQRLVFFEDGMQLFRRSPIIGLGVGAFENGIMDVQSFYYETRYVHNHYIQTLVETGVVGLVLFVALLGVSALAIVRARRREGFHPLVPALGAALVFMGAHAFTEVVFSLYCYLPFAFAVFALINLCCADALPLPLSDKPRGGVIGVFAAFIVLFTVLIGCNMQARTILDREPTLDTLETAIALDRYEWADYMLSYVMSSTDAAEGSNQNLKAEEYAGRLATVKSNIIQRYLADYYFTRGDVDRGFEMLEIYVDYVSSNPDTWNSAFALLEKHERDTDRYREGVARIRDMMTAWDEAHIGSITLDEASQSFLTRLFG